MRWSGIRTPTVRFFGCCIIFGTSRDALRMNVRPGGRLLHGPEHPVVHLDELAQLRELVDDEREVVLVVELADAADPLALRVAERATQREARVRGVRDQAAVAQDLRDLRQRPRLRVVRVNVEVLSHVVSLSSLALARRLNQRGYSRRAEIRATSSAESPGTSRRRSP